VLPYAKDFSIMSCPADNSSRPVAESTFDQDLVPGDTYSRYYTASQRSNMGYNYLFLSPIYNDTGQWISTPRTSNDIEAPSATFMFVDTVHDLDANHNPTGGGNMLVVPPCRYQATSTGIVDSFTGQNGAGPDVYTPHIGWDVNTPSSPYAAGGAWAWHSDHVMVSNTDGASHALTIAQLSQGCNVQTKWQGFVANSQRYYWSTHPTGLQP